MGPRPGYPPVLDTCFTESTRKQVAPMLAPLIYMAKNPMDMMVSMHGMIGANFSLTETVIEMPMGMSGTVKDMVNVIYPIMKEQMIYWVEDWLHSSMKSEDPIWKRKHIGEDESVESMESMEYNEAMDSMRSMQPMRHKKPSKGSMWQKESSMQTWQMVFMEKMLHEQKKTIKKLKEGIDNLWI